MVDIMLHMQDYLDKDTDLPYKVLSGGDQLTCERQVGAQRHRMDGDSPREQLQLLEPQCEDWHALMCFLKVCCYDCMSVCMRERKREGERERERDHKDSVKV